MKRIIIIPSFKKLEITSRLLAHLAHHIYYIVVAKKRGAYRLYANELIFLSEKLPYPIIRKLDEKLGISLAWENAYHPSIERELLLARKLRELTPSDIQSIVSEFVSYFDLLPRNIEEEVRNYLQGRITEEELRREIELSIVGVCRSR